MSAMAPAPALPADLASALDLLRSDLTGLFGPRLASLVAYGPRLVEGPAPTRASGRPPLNTLALLDRVTMDDLQACASRAATWRNAGLAIPLLLGQHDFARSLDVFPFDYGDIIARHVVLVGPNPFEGMTPTPDDLRRACEAQAKSHLIHLREGYLEAGGRSDLVSRLLERAAAPLASLLGHVGRLRGRHVDTVEGLAGTLDDVPGVSVATVREVLGQVRGATFANDDGRRLYPDYLRSIEALVDYLDGWSARA
jgi:hypothetical protein